MWKPNDEYIFGKNIVTKLRIVNDTRGRGIKLCITDYNRLITKSEEQKQFLLQIFAQHPKDFSRCKTGNIGKNIVKW